MTTLSVPGLGAGLCAATLRTAAVDTRIESPNAVEILPTLLFME
jgi:hypothetical protein